MNKIVFIIYFLRLIYYDGELYIGSEPLDVLSYKYAYSCDVGMFEILTIVKYKMK